MNCDSALGSGQELKLFSFNSTIVATFMEGAATGGGYSCILRFVTFN